MKGAELHCPLCGVNLTGATEHDCPVAHGTHERVVEAYRRLGAPRPLPPDQIKPLPDSVGIYEGEGGARKPPPPPPPAPAGFGVPEIRGPFAPMPPGFPLPEKFSRGDPRWRPGALRRFIDAIRFRGLS